MKIQLDWLKTYIDHGLSAEKLSHLLTMGGLEMKAWSLSIWGDALAKYSN